MAYAIFENGSHQYRVSEGDRVTVDRRDGEIGTEVVFDKVLLIAGGEGAQIGTPCLPVPRWSARSAASSATRRSSSRSFAAARTCGANEATASPTRPCRSPAWPWAPDRSRTRELSNTVPGRISCGPERYFHGQICRIMPGRPQEPPKPYPWFNPLPTLPKLFRLFTWRVHNAYWLHHRQPRSRPFRIEARFASPCLLIEIDADRRHTGGPGEPIEPLTAPDDFSEFSGLLVRYAFRSAEIVCTGDQ